MIGYYNLWHKAIFFFYGFDNNYYLYKQVCNSFKIFISGFSLKLLEFIGIKFIFIYINSRREINLARLV